MRPINIIPPGNDAGELKRSVVALDQKFRPRLGRGVRIGGFQDVFFFHGLRFEGFSLSIHFIGADVDETLHATMTFGRLEKDVSAEDIGLGEVKGVAETVVHVRLGGEVHDGVDLLLDHDV